ncbi:MAG: hypothetical protein R6X29_03515 [Acidimicrobiia bacterium]|jgi:hypothetical protein
MDAILGHYAGEGIGFTLVRSGGEILLVFPDAPERHEPRLVRDGDGWRISGGFLEGVPVGFTDGGMMAGRIVSLERTNRPPAREPGSGLLAPTWVEDARFTDLWMSHPANGSVLELPPGVPLHAFVQWLTARDAVIFHGSNRRDIDEFRPRRTSTELRDRWGRGNLAAVYGTHDGLWAMFFAVVDRSRLRGSIRNGVTRFSRPDGDHLDVYRFSVSSVSLPDRPWTEGALYLLPRTTFDRLPLYPDGPPSWEWASVAPVRPLARLPVLPEDFPFLDRIGGHDDGPLLELADLWDRVYAATVEAEPVGGGYRMVVDLEPTVLDRWSSLLTEFHPQAAVRIDLATQPPTVQLSGPPAFLQVHDPTAGRRARGG